MVKDGIYLSGRYQVLSKIGAGGMADVYKAKDCMLTVSYTHLTLPTKA